MKHLYIILFVLPLIGLGQGWEETYGYYLYNTIQSVQPTDDGGYVVCGSTGLTLSVGMSEVNNNGDMYILKVDESGDEIWSQIYDNGIGHSIQPTDDGGHIITGTKKVEDGGSTPSEDFYIMKINENGDSLWTNSFGGENGDVSLSVQQTDDGGYVMFGWSNSKSIIGSVGTYNSDYWMLKTDENGDSLWSKNFGTPENDYGREIHQTIDGGYVLIGEMNNSLGVNEWDSVIYLIKTDENGDSLWSKNFEDFNGESYFDIGSSIKPTDDGGYIITGRISYDPILIKTDENGDLLWYNTFNPGFYWGEDVHQTTDGGYILLLSGSLTSPPVLIKTDENGEEEWSQIFTIQEEYVGEDVSETLDGGYIITGYKFFGVESLVGFLIKTDSEGNVETTSTIELPTPTSKRELIKTTNILGQENTTIKNQPLIEIYDDGSTEKKIVIE